MLEYGFIVAAPRRVDVSEELSMAVELSAAVAAKDLYGEEGEWGRRP